AGRAQGQQIGSELVSRAEMAQLAQIIKTCRGQLTAEYTPLVEYAELVSEVQLGNQQLDRERIEKDYAIAPDKVLRLPQAMEQELLINNRLQRRENASIGLDITQGLTVQAQEVNQADQPTGRFPVLKTLEFVTAQIVDPTTAPPSITLQQEEVVVAEIALEPVDDGLETFEFVTGQLEKREREGNLLTRLLPGRRQTEWVVRRQRRQARQLVEELPGGVTLEMVAIPSGIFMMGSPEDEVDRSTREGAQHEVSVFPFLLGKYPVTQAQWRAVAGLPPVEIELTPDPSSFKGDNRPVESVNWHEAVEFCARLSAHTNRQYGLPSEAQWEYACRAGTTTPFHFGETITTNLANYNGTDRLGYDSSGSYGTGPKGESREKTTPVVLFEIANRFGLWDMHGNVWEWCADHWHNGYTGAPIDGTAWLNDEEEQAKQHVLRGGSWFNPPSGCCSTSRLNFSSGTRNFGLGFRASCILKTGSA
ncbi:MAG: formylglycine-generating enzyme family protein, partial [Cyanobacteria bacterium J06632_22]